MVTRPTNAAVQASLDLMARDYWRVVENYAHTLRERYVVPFCDKRGMEFLAGNGSWVFHKGTQYWNQDDLANVKGTVALLAVLTAEEDVKGLQLGSLMANYNPPRKDGDR